MSEIDLIVQFLRGASGPAALVLSLGYLLILAIRAARPQTTQRSGGQAISAGGDVAIGPAGTDMRCPPDVERSLARIALATEASMGMIQRQGEILMRQTTILEALSSQDRVVHDLLLQLQAEARMTDSLIRNSSGGGRE